MKTELSKAIRTANPEKSFLIKDKKTGIPWAYFPTRVAAESALLEMKNPKSFKAVRLRIA